MMTVDVSTSPPVTTGDPILVSHGTDPYGRYFEWTVGSETQRMRWVNPGQFMMGSPASEAGRLDRETRHLVTHTRGYWLAETACTQRLWQAVTGHNPAKFKGPNRPVESVSWNDTIAFMARLNQRCDALRLRLPTEAEWENACRAGTRTPFSFGENITPELVNYNGNYPYNGGPTGIFRYQTVDVKSLPPNPAGFYEMHGNTWEWCQDFYLEDLGTAPAVDPKGPPQAEFRLMRGGCWYDEAGSTRSAFRDIGRQTLRMYLLGVRFARDDVPFD